MVFSTYMYYFIKNSNVNVISVLACTSASLAQSAARQSHNLKVVSSSLTGGTFFLLPQIIRMVYTIIFHHPLICSLPHQVLLNEMYCIVCCFLITMTE